MNFAFSEEQEELRRIVRQFLEQKSPESEVRRLMETTEGYDPATWSQLAEQLGLQSLIIPEEFGGQGYGYVELTEPWTTWKHTITAGQFNWPFGFEVDKFEVSQKLGERVLLPAVRREAERSIIVSDGFSCCEQITQNTTARPMHFA